MSEIRLDPKLGESAAEAITSCLNGRMQESIIALYQECKNVGEDNPIVDQLGAICKEYERSFNEDVVPLVNKIKGNMEANAEFAAMINNYSVAKVSGPADLGSVSDHNYDAAKNL